VRRKANVKGVRSGARSRLQAAANEAVGRQGIYTFSVVRTNMQADEGKVRTNVGPFFQVKPILF